MSKHIAKIEDFRLFKIEDHLYPPENTRYLEHIQDMWWVVTEDGCVLQSKIMKLWQCRTNENTAEYLCNQFEGCSIHFIKELWFKYEN